MAFPSSEPEQARVRRAVDDFCFPLMRHWTVYDSIVHSRYVATRLQTWQEKGKDKVKELLVRMGLSQRDCQADYCERPTPPPLASANIGPSQDYSTPPFLTTLDISSIEKSLLSGIIGDQRAKIR